MNQEKAKKPLYKKCGLFLIIGIIIAGTTGCSGGNDNVNKENVPPPKNQVESSSGDKSADSKDDISSEDNMEDATGKVPTEYKSALKKAKLYSDSMHMSKIGVYDQLTSEHGEKFTEEAGQYAIDRLEADWKENALKKAKTYQESMSMSPNAIYDQLISEHGEKFTEEEAQYAIDNLD